VGHFKSADWIVLRMVRAREVDKRAEPRLVGAIERLAALADIPAPQVALSPLAAPNALATGISRPGSTVVVTEALLHTLTPEELEAVLAHEVSHVANRDAAVLAAATSFRSIAALFGDPRLTNPDAELDANFRARIGRVVSAPVRWPLLIVGTPLVLALSRYREYAADRGSALLTGRPEELMSALRKLSGATPPELDLRAAGASAFWIVPVRRSFELLSDHPPLEKRLHRLERIARELGKPVSA
jgi:heat shock protein HtpX